ncbi:Cytochrome b-c1 complex subunit Rieske, mitochondrial [Armadillidium nasatum]|uniref:Cytochrome b-c1 complex subunit Rieske, mitochondrial n=1 Tax=Armadillidium nasatum TaxID=96803 RepID=A0A5N5SSP7_9CRUS|nr:Cytochrome b-c1 complex subunit Rieske, mitochondrial [Armadillidium nasatum]
MEYIGDMISVAGRSASLAWALKSSSQAVASGVKGIGPSTIVPKKAVPSDILLDSATVLSNGNLKVSSGIGVGTQVRYAHTDVEVPDFSAVRKKITKNPNVRSKDTAAGRNSFVYMVSLGNLVCGTYVAKTVVTDLVTSLAPSAAALNMAKIEIKTTDIPEGASMTFKWRGKPLFVRHRTDSEIATERAVDVSSLRDPQTDDERVNDPKFLVVIGVCTHLGCVPIANAGDFGGYYCPCHGSHYDASGRVRKGPAPTNLEVPEYSFPEPGLLVVG